MCLLDSGADIDYPNKNGDSPMKSFLSNPLNNVPINNYLSMKCMAATCIAKYRIPYRNLIPKTLEQFVENHHYAKEINMTCFGGRF